jgi:hypothetical protein
MDDPEAGDCLAISDRTRDFYWPPVPGRMKPWHKLAHLLVLDQIEVGVAATSVSFGVADLIWMAIDRRAQLARTSAMVDVSVAKDHPVQATSRSREDRRTSALDASVKGNRPIWAVQQVNVRSKRVADAYLLHAGRNLRHRCRWLAAHAVETKARPTQLSRCNSWLVTSLTCRRLTSGSSRLRPREAMKVER